MRAFYGAMVVMGFVGLMAAASAHEWVSVALTAVATAWFIYRLEHLPRRRPE